MAITDPITVVDASAATRTFNRLKPTVDGTIYAATHFNLPASESLENASSERMDKKRGVNRRYHSIRINVIDFDTLSVERRYGVSLNVNYDICTYITRTMLDQPVKMVCTLATTSTYMDKIYRLES